MKKNLLLCTTILLMVACESGINTVTPSANSDLITTSEIDNFILDYVNQNGVFDWKNASEEMQYSAAMHSDSLFAIGYTPNKAIDASSFIGTEALSQEWIDKRSELLNQILKMEQEYRNDSKLTLENILPFELDNEIPTFSAQILNPEALTYLRSNEGVRYVEPMGYDLQNAVQERSDSGCDGDPNYGISSSDYTTVSPSVKAPWNFYNHNIPAAWNHSTGDNIRICIIDSGASDNQNNLGSQFAVGESTSRSILKYSTHYSGAWWWKTLDSPHDQCGHGTSMAGLAGAPKGSDGNAVGVAYKADMMTVRAVEDVLISSSNEKNGVKEALKLAGNRSDVKIISMSIGNIISSSTVSDGVYYAYNKGKLIFAAAGTSTSFTNWTGVIFPASMSQCVAVTGVKEQSSLQRCNTCHSGSKVEFVITMQRSNNNDRTSLALALSSDQPKHISGSSCATATTAGIAALVWATNPSMSRTTVLNRLRQASQLYPNKDSDYGYGNIDALAAVLGN